jgi:hypothetical protein
MEMLEYLENKKIIQSFDVIDYRKWRDGQYTNIKIEFVDKSVLYVKEYNDEASRNYSYHWQDRNKKLISRWDNSPHYPDHITFPHHKHLPDRLIETIEITIKDVLKIIEREILKGTKNKD